MKEEKDIDKTEEMSVGTAVIEEQEANKEKIDKEEQNEKQKIIDDLLSENEKLKDQLLRLAAEYDNYRKRREREVNNIIINANADLILRLLPILDDLDRMVEATATGVDADSLVEGLKLLQKNLMKVLEDEGLQPMQSLGQPFDPEKHEALLHVVDEKEKENTVIDEHKKGYLFKDRVLRHAHVIVSKKNN